jgi:hypothetical protein
MSQNLHYSYSGGKMAVKDIKHFLSKSYDKNLDNHGEYQIDKLLSGTRAQVYHNPNRNHTVVVHKGTDYIHDWITDLRLGLGERSGKRFKHAKDVQQKAEQKYVNSNVSTLGHSLGSKLAEEASQNPKNEIITLNNPTVISDLIKKPKSNVYNIRTSMDPVSILRNVVPSKSKNDLTIKSTSFNPLIEHKTDTLNRINQEMEIGQGMKGGMLCRGKTSDVIPNEEEFSTIGMNETNNTQTTRSKPTNNRRHYRSNISMSQLEQELYNPNTTAQDVLNIFNSLTPAQRSESRIAQMLIQRYDELI